MTWSDQTPTPDPAPAPGVGVPVTPTPVPTAPLPPFAPHESTTSTGGTVGDTLRTDLGLLEGLVGQWSGAGLNAIWTPSHQPETGSSHFLQLAATLETQSYESLGGNIPNRGLAQADLFMGGAQYTQRISNLKNESLHFEHGVWLNVPATTVPAVAASVARMASIPHGTTINAQGTVRSVDPASLAVPPVSMTPFAIGNPGSPVSIEEQDLAVTTKFRTADLAAQGFDQTMLNDMNTFLRQRLPGGAASVTEITVDTVTDSTLMPGGGVSNTAFLGPNAETTKVVATIWLLTMPGEARPSKMLYTQTVLLDFGKLSWPHVTVGALGRIA